MIASFDSDKILAGYPVKHIRQALLHWWVDNKRSFPWRETQDPYKILVAEILLHRTKANQVIPLYELFLQHFPDIQTLSKSSPCELAALFHSAGLRWRWKLIYAMALELQTRFQGNIPDDKNTLIALPGISNYIASAVRCFAFGYPDAILDTNTVRVAGRLLDLTITDSSRRSKLFRHILEHLIDPDNPREFNFALIDLAAQVCKSLNPLHAECCLKQYCLSNRL